MNKLLGSVFAKLGLFYVAIIWGSTFLVVKDSLNHIDPIILVGYRFILAALILIPFLLITKRNMLSHVKEGILLGIFLWLIFIPQTVGLRYTTAANSVFITGLFIAFVPIFSFLFFHKIPSVSKGIAISLALLGLWYITGGVAHMNTGDVMTIFTAIAYALYLLLSDKYVNRNLDPYVLAFQEFIFVGLFSCFIGLLFHLPFTIGSTNTIHTVIFLAIFPSLSAFVIQLFAQKYTTPVQTAIIFAFEPVIGALFAWIIGHEPYTEGQIIGGICMFFAIIISEINFTKFYKK